MSRFLRAAATALGALVAITAVALALPGQAAAAAAGPTVYIASDSTAQTYNASFEPQTGWGQVLDRYFADDVTVANHAIGGRSSRSFIEQGRLRTILDQIQPGDYLFVQFGHNDASVNIPERYTSPEDYKEYLRNDYIAGARARGATPVIITPVSRRSFDAATGRFNVSFPQYVQRAIEVANEEGVPLIDLSAASRAYLDSIGPEAARDVFLHTDPGEYPNRPGGTADDTHFQRYGALQMARLVARATAGLGVPLSGLVRTTTADVYDLGPSGAPVASSYTQVTAATAYTAQRGYGIVGSGLIERDRGSSMNALQRDFVALFNGSYQFRADVPNGAYEVRLYVGDANGSARTNVTLEGSVQGRLAPASGTATAQTFAVTVTDGRLDLALSGETAHLNAVEILPAA
ncbi:rhamnogalacturonan acetylesterase [Streptomyces litchfieldiae]|uniref:GDSL-type esterase/lipase family protein n=1 Tax=Streptomyces litchfieldiae TaxID=3075543 RepID=A0ABU2N1R1_9ACTN|nr:GDSL-type esterase/lipase family protein [Streptomyces sp. DSM 44938]MDT0347710.1 GDSL-type esterase/lipase family protein [Streptomyces sp. DSM 44938]